MHAPDAQNRLDAAYTFAVNAIASRTAVVRERVSYTLAVSFRVSLACVVRFRVSDMLSRGELVQISFDVRIPGDGALVAVEHTHPENGLHVQRE